MTNKLIKSFKGGINLSLPAWHEDMATRHQCVLMNNLRYSNDFVETVPGTKKYHGTTMGAYPVTAILPYYNDQTDDFKLLAACGDKIYKRNPETNEMEVLASALTPGSIHGSDTRYDTLYIPSTADGLKKYLGGNKIERVGGGSTAPGSFRQVLYMKEIDRLFGISDDAIYGQISWCDIGEPEVWQGDSIQRFKLKDGERVEGGAILYGKLIVFCTYTIWIYFVSGNEENWRLEEAPTSVGCVAPNTIKKSGANIYFLGESPRFDLGVYRFNGTTSELLTDDVTPIFRSLNRNRIRLACAEIHGSLYTLSMAYGFSETNNISIDMDLVNAKEDGTPAIYGIHDFGFVSSCVLNGRQNNKEFLMGGEGDGFVYVEGGTSWKGVNGDDGELIAQRFLSRVHNEGNFDTMKKYNFFDLYFRPSGFFNAKFRHYISYGSLSHESFFNPNADYVGFAGHFNVFEKPLQGTPDVYTFQHFPEMNSCRGTSIQFEILNHSLNGEIAFDAYKYDFDEIHETKRVQSYAF